MAFTRKMIKDAAKECGIETDLPKEFIDALMESHVEARDAYAEKAVEGAQKSSESVDVKESEEYKALEKEYNDYKSEQEGKESQAAKEAAAREFYESRFIKGANLKIAMRSSAAEIAALELDKNGKIKNEKVLGDLVEGDLSGLVQTQTVTGIPTPTPPKGQPGGGVTRESIMAIKDRGERRKAIAENPQLFGQTAE